jgi:hypothetical protein
VEAMEMKEDEKKEADKETEEKKEKDNSNNFGLYFMEGKQPTLEMIASHPLATERLIKLFEALSKGSRLKPGNFKIRTILLSM